MTYLQLSKQYPHLPTNEINTLICHICGLSPAEFLACRGEDISDGHLERITDGIKRLEDGEPIQYITGTAYFYGFEFFVDRRVLIPRFDTETVVEYCISNIPKNSLFADICCGSGCIGLSVLKHRADLKCIFADISTDALDVCTANAKRIGISEKQAVITEFDALDKERYGILKGISAAVSNPPYIASDTVPTLDRQVLYEPVMALDGGSDGLDFYRTVTKNILSCFDGRAHIIYEIGYDQSDALTRIAADNGLRCNISNDLSGNPRMAVLT